MTIHMFETDTHNQTLIVGGWKADLYATDDGYLVLDRNDEILIDKANGTVALRIYNEANNTELQPSFFGGWLKYYREMDKNLLTRRRYPAYQQRTRDTRVSDYMKTHKEEVEKIRRRNGL